MRGRRWVTRLILGTTVPVLVAAGTSKAVITHWDGSAWNLVPSPSPSPQLNSLNGVTAISATDAWAVGSAAIAATDADADANPDPDSHACPLPDSHADVGHRARPGR